VGKFDQIIANAKVALTDIHMRSINTGDWLLKVKPYIEELNRQLAVLEEDKYDSLLGRVKDAMYDTSADAAKNAAARKAVDLTFQLNHCSQCKCVTCPIIDENCRCEGCLYGSHVVTCPGGLGTETRRIDQGVVFVDGLQATLAEYDRETKQTAITLIERNGTQRRYHFNLRTGEKSPW
jgi:hypothetical protein